MGDANWYQLVPVNNHKKISSFCIDAMIFVAFSHILYVRYVQYIPQVWEKGQRALAN